jgi:uncharacterized protein (TIGR03437 family)
VSSDCRPPGTVTVGGTAYTTDVESWVTEGSEVVLQAIPNPGFVFTNWGPPANFATAFTHRFIVRGPVTFTNIFSQGKRVTIHSEPAGLLVAPDRTPTRAPAEVDWAPGSRHVLGVVSPQSPPEDSSKLYVFKSWSNGTEAFGAYTVSDANIPESLTAYYVPGARVSFLTNPLGLRVRVEGRENWPAYNFIWGEGLKYTVSAPAEQTDSRGRKYVFKSWSNEGPATQEITVLPEHVANGFRLTANYEPQNRVTINTNPPGLLIQVDGQDCRGACVVNKSEGAQVQLSAPATIPLSPSSRYEFTGWSDGGEAQRTFTVPADAQATLVANYRTLYRLTAVAEPGNGARFQVEPASEDGFYGAETQVSVTAETRPGYRFRRWEGDLNGSFRTGVVSMTVPRLVRAVFDISPYANEAGVRNAAGETPVAAVAPGSIASIFGANLAGGEFSGPTAPLAQTIGGVTVRLGSRLLPLLFVSPEQINLQVPVDLAEGSYPLAIKWETYPEVQTTMRVARNAPGLFQKAAGEAFHAIASREDGSEITLESPALRGETITLFGTGFGPYQRPVLDGFPLPADPAYLLADQAEVLIGDRVLEANWAGGVPGQIGTSMVRFVMPADVEAPGGSLSVRIRVNGVESNPVHLPVLE